MDRVPNFPTPDFLRIRATFIAIFSHFATVKGCDICLARYYVAEIARFLVHSFFFSLEIDPAGSSLGGEIFLSPAWIEESYFESRTSDKRRHSIVKYFKVSTWDFLNCSPSGIGMNIEEFWWTLCAQFWSSSKIFEGCGDARSVGWKRWDTLWSCFIYPLRKMIGRILYG